MRMIRGIYAWLLMVLMMASCSKVPDNILSEKKMQAVLADMVIAEALSNIEVKTFKTDTMKLALYESVFRKHNIPRALYDSSLVWYGQHLDIYMKVYERVERDLDNRAKTLGDVQADAAPSSNQDSVNIWPRRPSLTLSPKSVFNAVTFDIKPEKNYSSGSIFVLGMNVWGLNPKSKYKPEVHISTMQSDTTMVVSKTIDKDGYFEVTVRTKATKQVRRVYGYIRMNHVDSTYNKIYIDDIKLMKYKYGKRKTSKSSEK